MTPRAGRVHLVGIGGMHMSAIAQILLSDGVRVSGSDLVMSELTERVRALGARVYEGHRASNIGEASVVVTTAAARPDNPELVEAARRGIPVLQRHEMVAELMQNRTAIAVAGTHGKTTTSSLVAFILSRAGRDPTYLLGGESLDLGGNAAAGRGREVVVEADEYAGAFLAYHPEIAVVTNAEADHLDYYGSEERLLSAFRRFIDNVPGSGLVVACAESEPLRRLCAPEPPAAAIAWYGLDAGDWRAAQISLEEGGGATFMVQCPHGERGPFRLRLPGLHNVCNAVAALVVAERLGIPCDVSSEALSEFRGAHRRFEVQGEAGGVLVIDDYAHHPTEVRATLAAARSRYPGRRTVVLFQPHTYTRTQYLLNGFKRCFVDADRLLLLQTFAAREAPDAGIDAHDLARELGGGTPVADTLAEAVQLLTAELRRGDVCFTMGAGDVTKVGRPLLEALQRR
jgi:UDP-N-acetylmuramate--alanine ligase